MTDLREIGQMKKPLIDVRDNIKKIIVEKGFLQKAVAERMGLTSSQFSNMIKGRKLIKHTDIMPICLALGVSPNELFGYEEPNRRNRRKQRRCERM